MKRNMELIREILLFIEEKCDGSLFVSIDSLHLHEQNQNIVQQHAKLIAERGLATFRLIDQDGYCFDGLTWCGHDFLDNARNSTVWNAAIKSAGKLSFGVFQKVLQASAIAFAMNTLKGAFQ